MIGVTSTGGRSSTRTRRVNLGSPHRIPNGEGRVFIVDGREIAVFRTRSGTMYATDAWCPHAGGPLADGLVGAGKVVCPLHGYRFSLRTGEPDGHSCGSLRTYPVSIGPTGDVLLTIEGDEPVGEVHVVNGARARDGALRGRTVAVLETRMGSTLADMLRREGAQVMAAPSLVERHVDALADVHRWADGLVADEYQVVMFLTGVGATCVLEEAARLGRLEEVRDALLRTTVMARGPKPAAALNRRGITVTVTVPEPWTTRECVETLRRLPLAGQRVALVHYGERNAQLAEAIVQAGASLDELCVYEWRLPEDVSPLRNLVSAIVNGRVDAVLFTSQVQVRHLLQVAEGDGLAPALIEALNTRTTTASIGPTCSAALRQRGIAPHLEPQRPKLGPLVDCVADHFRRIQAN